MTKVVVKKTVLNKKLFGIALKKKPLAVSNFFVLYYIEQQNSEPNLGMIVAKKILKKASKRNYIKRIIRFYFKQNQLNSGFFLIRLRFSTTAHLITKKQWLSDLKKLWCIALKNL